MNNKYLFSLFSSVFIWKKKKYVLFYDTNKFTSKLFYITDYSTNLFIDNLMNIDNLYCIEINTNDNNIALIINELIRLDMGKIIHKSDFSFKFIQLPPILNLQSKIERLNIPKLTDLTVGENIMDNLYELNINLPNNPPNNYINNIITLLESIKFTLVSRINILSNWNIFNYSKNLFDKLKNTNIPICFTVYYKDITKKYILSLEELGIKNINLYIKVSLNDSLEYIYIIKSLVEKFVNTIEWEFIICNESDFIKYEEFNINKLSSSIIMKPKFTGENIDFFIKYVFLDKEDLLKSKVTKKNIFAKQVLNTNDFGKLTINHTGEVFANTYHKSLGTINDDIRELVCKEMNMGISWRRIRNMNPCCDCVFQWICPSPSDYEIEIMKPNLCNIDLNEFC